MSAALVLLGLGLLVWPVPSASQRRMGRLRAAARLAGRPAGSPRAWPGRADRSSVAAAGLVGMSGLAAALATGPTVGVAAAAGSGAVAVVTLSARSARREAGRRRDLLTALGLLRGELEAGTPFAAALRVARDRAGTAAGVFELGGGTAAGGGEAVGGAGVAEAARRALLAGVGVVAATGASWSTVAAGVGRDVEAREARERELATALAGARASTVVLAGLPVLGLGLAAALGADPVGFLLGGGLGSVALAAGAVLDLLGVVAAVVVAGRVAR